MKDKQYDPAGNNEKSPAPGMASVNTFNEGEDSNDKNDERKNQKEVQKPSINKPSSEQKD